MNDAPPDIAAELFEECGFWARFTGEVRRPAEHWLGTRVLAGTGTRAGTRLALRTSRSAPRRPPDTRCEVLLIYVTENQRHAVLPWIGMKPVIQTAAQLPGADWQISWSRCRAVAHASLRMVGVSAAQLP